MNTRASAQNNARSINYVASSMEYPSNFVCIYHIYVHVDQLTKV